jgi:metallophosphoesterase superfamily enzyme
MGRPPTRPKKLRDGFYIEVRNKGAKNGIKIVRNTREEMLKAIKDYSKTKEVVILGESKNGKWVESAG